MKTSSMLRRLPAHLVAASLLIPGCTLVHDFGEDLEGGTSAESDEGGAADGSSEGGAGEASSWQNIWGEGSGASYHGITLTASGDIVVVGGLQSPSGTFEGLIHRYSAGGELLDEIVIPGEGELSFQDSCETPGGVLRVLGHAVDDWAEPQLASSTIIVDLVEGQVEATLPYDGALAQSALHTNGHFECDELGAAWVGLGWHGTQSTLARFDEGGVIDEILITDAGLRDFAYSDGALDVVTRNEETFDVKWQRLGIDGSLQHESMLSGEMDWDEPHQIDVRGDRVAMAGSTATLDSHYLAVYDRTGTEVWRHERLSGGTFSAYKPILGASGELAVTVGQENDLHPHLYVFDAAGAVLRNEPLIYVPDQGDAQIGVSDLALADDGVIVLGGSAFVLRPGDPIPPGFAFDTAWLSRILPTP